MSFTHRVWFYFIWISFFFLGPGTVPASSSLNEVLQVHRPHVDVGLIAQETSVAPGGELHAGIYFELERGWHIYWVNAGDSGQAPRLNWTLPAGLRAAPIEWPAPEKLEAGSLVTYGYTGSVLLPVNLKVSSDVQPGEVRAVADLHWLVCHESCIPGQAHLELPLLVRVGAQIPSEQASFFSEIRHRIPLSPPTAWQASAKVDRSQFEIQIQGNLGGSLKQAHFFPLKNEIIENAGNQRLLSQTSENGVEELWLRVPRSAQLVTPPSELAGVLQVDGKFYDLKAAVQVVAHLDPWVEPLTPTTDSWAEAIFFALLGGLILNLMPCVFPVLSIKALSLLSMSRRKNSEIRAEGVAYTLGVLLSFWLFASATLALRSGGQALGWGFQLQQPLFVGGLGLLFFLMALNLFGVFEMSVGPAAGIGHHMAARSGHLGAFFAGALATLVATPCTAPFMGTALGFAMSQSAVGVFTIFSALGLGLAAPYLLLSLMPHWASYLPRPGRWMETFRQILAFPLLGTVIWLVWVFNLQTGAEATAIFLASLLVAGFGAWALGRWRGGGGRAAFALSIVLSVWIGAQATGASFSPRAVEWQSYSKAKLESLRAEGKPVFVDFTAAWCVTCQVNESLALNRADVIAAMKESGVVTLRGDWTNANPEITQALSEFGRNGVPLYLFYSGQPGTPARVLPQILTPGVVLGEIRRRIKQ